MARRRTKIVKIACRKNHQAAHFRASSFEAVSAAERPERQPLLPLAHFGGGYRTCSLIHLTISSAQLG
jgi:hypothetical protein